MTTFTWAGGGGGGGNTALWSSPNWTIDGVATAFVPGIADIAVMNSPGHLQFGFLAGDPGRNGLPNFVREITLDNAGATLDMAANIVLGRTVNINAGLVHALTNLSISGVAWTINGGSVVVDSAITVSMSAGIINSSTVTVSAGTMVSFNLANTATGVLLVANGGTVVETTTTNSGLIALSTGGMFNGLSGQFGTISFLDGAGSHLILPGSGAIATTIVNFQAGDFLALGGKTFDASYQAEFSAGTLVMSNSGGVVQSFSLVGIQPGAHFSVAADSANRPVVTTDSVPCFRAGTRVLTARGMVAVEALLVGERMVLAGGGFAAMVWLGHRRVRCDGHPQPWDVLPIRVCAGAFGAGMPIADLWLSPDHAVAWGGRLVPVRYLVNGASVAQEAVAEVTYWHVELPEHGLLLAEGLAVESYLDTGNRADFANGGAAMVMHPGFARGGWEGAACAPLCVEGAEVVALRRWLLARCGALGWGTTDAPGLEVLADGVAVDATRQGALVGAALPPGTFEVVLRSRSNVPAEMSPEGRDYRRLGVAVAGVRLDGVAVGAGDARWGAGWHAAEDGWRWTDGEAVIAAHGARRLDFGLVLVGRYWLPRATSAVDRAADFPENGWKAGLPGARR